MMDAYTKELLALAVEACEGYGASFTTWLHPDHGWTAEAVEQEDGHNTWVGSGPTLADALAALLRDLGVEVPERPSAERVAGAAEDWCGTRGGPDGPGITYLRELYRREPLTVLALLEGGAS